MYELIDFDVLFVKLVVKQYNIDLDDDFEKLVVKKV